MPKMTQTTYKWMQCLSLLTLLICEPYKGFSTTTQFLYSETHFRCKLKCARAKKNSEFLQLNRRVQEPGKK